MKVSSLVAAGVAFVGLASAQSSTSRAASASATTKAASATTSSKSMQTYNPLCLNSALQNIPSCGLSILTSVGLASFGCQLVDLGCQCEHYSEISKIVFNPVLSACGGTTALSVQTGADALCACVTYGTSVPPSANPYQTTSGINPIGNRLCVDYGLAIPKCGTAVLQSLAGSIGGCDDTDFECQCQHISAVQAIASTPVINSCGTTTALLVQSAADQLCSCITANNKGLPAPTAATSTLQGAAPQVDYSSGSWMSIFAGLLAFLL